MWSIVFIALLIRILVKPLRMTTFDVYRDAGRHWLQAETLYSGRMGFVYSPAVAAFFAPFALLPRSLGLTLWLGLNLAVFVLGLNHFLRTCPAGAFTPLKKMWVNLLLLPLVVGNLDVAQANPFVIGLLLLSVGSARKENWPAAALSIAVAASFKIYPLSLGLLFILAAPAAFALYLAAALLVCSVLPFAVQAPAYVWHQYLGWEKTRLADNRLEYSARHAPMDMWLILNHIFGRVVPEFWYHLLQVGAGAAIAAYVITGRIKGWSKERLLVGLFFLACIWMTLFGPATEGFTYILLAPPVILACLEARAPERPAWLKFLLLSSAILLFAAMIKNSFLHSLTHLESLRIMQPVAALFFLAYCLGWLLNDGYWRPSVPKSERQSVPVHA